MPSVRSFTVLPALPDSLKDLDFIARNMFWCWNLEFVEIFKRINSNLWKACGYNPIKLLGTVAQETLEALSGNEGFVCELQRSAEKLRAYLDSSTWFEKVSTKYEKPIIAYFSAEFGIHECLPVYSGGLGILAGDHLKSASDLGIPLVGIGLLYQKGYFRQYLNIDGWQQEVYAENDFYNIPIEIVRKSDGQPLTVSVEYPEGEVLAQIWCVSVGRVKLYLLDTNIAANSPQARMITANLYGGDREMRIRQEVMLGIGGLRALAALDIAPTVCHMNEGHAAFLALERIRQLTSTTDLTFEQAAEATKSGNVFTVHTPVKAGNDEFPTEMMEKYFAAFIPALGIDKKQFLALGRVNPDNDKESFKMPVLALRLSAYKNGVSKSHGQVSRKMWAQLWPTVPDNEVPIISITNGVHMKSWLSKEMNSLYERYLGSHWPDRIADKAIWETIDQIPDEEFWRTHQRCKSNLVAFARNRLKIQMQRRGTYHTELNWAEEVLDPEALTIAFARRFATYKRGNLLLKDPQRLVKLLSSAERPVQIVFAGKAHPRDTQGKEIIRQIIHFATQYNVRRRIVFLEDYDINVARFLVRGVDVWLNNPRPPMEASGTSGMKAAINGALNLSTLDGWWCEGYIPEGGWAIGAGETYDDTAYQDMVESQAIYNILENEVVPLFYTRSVDNLPRAWIRRMKNSIKWITPRFNTNRMVADYTRKFYVRAAAKWQYLTDDAMKRAKELADWKSDMRTAWAAFDIKDVQVKLNNGDADDQLNPRQPQLKVGAQLNIRALISLGKVAPDDVSVELYHGPVDSWGNIRDGSAIRMDYQETSDRDGEHWFAGLLSCKTSGCRGVAVRVVPKHTDLINPYELGLVLWENTAANTGFSPN
ncbi:MAG: alpha-glucan family phosphorylase [Planctomycetota bacterium]|jgi:starch phosphorylase